MYRNEEEKAEMEDIRIRHLNALYLMMHSGTGKCIDCRELRNFPGIYRVVVQSLVSDRNIKSVFYLTPKHEFPAWNRFPLNGDEEDAS